MKNKIVFTQDTAGERDWLKTCFPKHYFFETEFGGLWPPQPFQQKFPGVWEIPPDSVLDVSGVDAATYKSLYKVEQNWISPKWIQADNLLLNQQQFGTKPRSAKAQILHLPRSGTVFMESILFGICGYTKDRHWQPEQSDSDHWCLGGLNDHYLYKIVESSRPDIFFCYRKNWWQWFTSLQISRRHGYHHYFDAVDWNSLPAFEISQQDIDQTVSMVKAQWNALCHLRTHFADLNFYIFEHSDLVKHSNLTQHQALGYNKKRLIANYNEMQTEFESQCKADFDLWASRAIKHLGVMNCTVLDNFDRFMLNK